MFIQFANNLGLCPQQLAELFQMGNDFSAYKHFGLTNQKER